MIEIRYFLRFEKSGYELGDRLDVQVKEKLR